MKILYITNIPSPYRVAYFNKLGEFVDLTVIFERGGSTERDSSWLNYECKNFREIICKGKRIGVDSALSLAPVKHLSRYKYDWLILGNAMSVSGILEIIYLKMKRIPYWIEGDGAFLPTGREGVKFFIKKFILSGAKGYLSTCKNHDKYYMHYGVNKELIFRYPFSSLMEKDILKSPVTMDEKRILREKLGMKEKYIVVTVGQFIYRKGFDLLVKAGEKLGREVGIYFIGGERSGILADQEQLHSIPFQLPEALKDYYDAADVFVLPTREDIWGLVVNEAMARGLPVVTTIRCNAGVEMIRNGENGYTIPVENVEELVSKITIVLKDPEREKMGQTALETIRRYTIETMAERHIRIFSDLECKGNEGRKDGI
ncbi:MAG: glycosyltransferase family 4 protein [Blautia sp.]|nr:glycosyltransferase family 4 protein [Blautia sp.]